MALSAAELAAQLLQTAAFIDADPVVLAVSRKTRTRAPGGGVTATDPVGTISRRGRMILLTDRLEKGATDGSSPSENQQYTLMALPSEDFQEEDTFDFRGYPCRVASITVNEYQQHVRVVTDSG